MTDFGSEVAYLAAKRTMAHEFTVAKRVYIACEDYSPNARRRLHSWLDDHYGRPGLGESVAVAGSIEECLQRLEVLVALGVDELILNFVFDEKVSVERAAYDFVPRLARLAVSS